MSNLTFIISPPGLQDMDYLDLVRASSIFMLLGTIFSVSLFPFLIALYFFSDHNTKRRPVFHLNALAISFGIIQGILLAILNVSMYSSYFHRKPLTPAPGALYSLPKQSTSVALQHYSEHCLSVFSAAGRNNSFVANCGSIPLPSAWITPTCFHTRFPHCAQDRSYLKHEHRNRANDPKAHKDSRQLAQPSICQN